MKKSLVPLFLWGLATIIFAQIPDAFSYQAVIRDYNQALIKNQTVTVKATILRHDEVIFTQTQTATTNENGLLTLTLGNEGFQEINWLDGPLFIKTEIDPTGGNNFTIETETQLLTVPYAMATKTAETAIDVAGFEDLIERIENLEAQVEDLYLHLGIPMEIPFHEYSIDEPNCLWKLFMPGPQHIETVVVINSGEDLEQYLCAFPGYWEGDDFICNPCLNHPGIDFSKQTLILAHGIETSRVLDGYCTGLQKITKQDYIMKVHLFLSVSIGYYNWHVPIIINKLNEDSSIDLIVTFSQTMKQ